MASPEVESPVRELESRPEQVDAQNLYEHGITPTPLNPRTVMGDNGQPIAQSTGDDSTQAPPPGKVVYVTADQLKAKAWSDGNTSDARTWLGVDIIRRFKQALHFGWQVVVGKGNKNDA